MGEILNVFEKNYYDQQIQTLWEKDYDYVKKRIKIKRGKEIFCINSFTIFLPWNFFKKNTLNPGKSFAVFIAINPNIINADSNTRRFLLGHEYGHIIGWHTFAQTFAISLMIIISVLPLNPKQFIFGFFIAMALIIFGSNDSINKENFSDDVACDVIGIDNAILAIESIGFHTGNQDSTERERRIDRLKIKLKMMK